MNPPPPIEEREDDGDLTAVYLLGKRDGRDQAEKQIIEWLRDGTPWHTEYDTWLLGLAADAISRGEHRGG